MSVYVIAHKSKEFLDTPVFHAGPDDKEEAIAVFTERRLAEKYIADADWSDEYDVGELEPIQMLRWFTVAHEEGCDLVAINPVHRSQIQGDVQRVFELGEPLSAFANTLQLQLTSAPRPA